MVEKA